MRVERNIVNIILYATNWFWPVKKMNDCKIRYSVYFGFGIISVHSMSALNYVHRFVDNCDQGEQSICGGLINNNIGLNL